MDDPPVLSCGTLAPTGCWPVPKMIKVASDVGPTPSGTVDFTFTLTFGYAAKRKGQTEAGGGVWNSCPVPTVPKPNPVVVGNGLPYQIAATQFGQAS